MGTRQWLELLLMTINQGTSCVCAVPSVPSHERGSACMSRLPMHAHMHAACMRHVQVGPACCIHAGHAAQPLDDDGAPPEGAKWPWQCASSDANGLAQCIKPKCMQDTTPCLPTWRSAGARTGSIRPLGRRARLRRTRTQATLERGGVQTWCSGAQHARGGA